jgi:uncharacterized protein YoxC
MNSIKLIGVFILNTIITTTATIHLMIPADVIDAIKIAKRTGESISEVLLKKGIPQSMKKTIDDAISQSEQALEKAINHAAGLSAQNFEAIESLQNLALNAQNIQFLIGGIAALTAGFAAYQYLVMIPKIKGDTSKLLEDTKQLKEDVEEIKDTVSHLSENVGELSEIVNIHHEETRGLLQNANAKLDENAQNMEGVQENVNRIKENGESLFTELVQLKNEQKVLETVFNTSSTDIKKVVEERAKALDLKIVSTTETLQKHVEMKIKGILDELEGVIPGLESAIMKQFKEISVLPTRLELQRHEMKHNFGVLNDNTQQVCEVVMHTDESLQQSSTISKVTSVNMLNVLRDISTGDTEKAQISIDAALQSIKDMPKISPAPKIELKPLEFIGDDFEAELFAELSPRVPSNIPQYHQEGKILIELEGANTKTERGLSLAQLNYEPGSKEPTLSLPIFRSSKSIKSQPTSAAEKTFPGEEAMEAYIDADASASVISGLRGLNFDAEIETGTSEVVSLMLTSLTSL